MNLRDIQLRQQERDAKKADTKPRYRAVLCAADGSRTTGSVWADENKKIVWFQFFGSGGVGKALCKLLVPELNLGVYVSPADDKLGWVVVETDRFLRQTATDNRNYETIAPSDLQPGGRLMLWVDSRQISPLATYDTSGTLLVNVVAGDYPYGGIRKSYVGAVNIDLSGSQPTGPTEHRYVGLYLDSSNTLQTVNGTVVSTSTTPPEPTWPAGAFLLSVVRINDTQTSFSFADDILDRRMTWSDENGGGGGGGWPAAGKAMINNTEYASIAAAHTVASAGDIIKVGQGTFTENLTISKGVTLVGLDPTQTIITDATNNDVTIDITAAGVTLRNLTINWTGAGTSGGCIQSNQNNTVLENVILNKTSGTPGLAACYLAYGGTHRFTNVRMTCSSATTSKYGLYNITADVTVTVEGGEISGSTYDIITARSGSTIKLNNTVLTNNLVSWAGTITDLSRATQLWESDFGAVAWLTDAAGDLTGSGKKLYCANVREKLTTNLTYYVRTDGSDSNNGLVNSAGGAFLTVQKAIDVAAAFDLNGYTITINVADGTYNLSTGIITKTFVGDGTISLVGNTGTPANVLLRATSAIGILTCSHGPVKYSVSGFKFDTNQATGIVAIVMNNQSKLTCANIDFGAMSSNSDAGQHLNLDENSILTWTTGYTVSGRFGRHFNLAGLSLMNCFNQTITISGSPSGTHWAYMYGMANCDYYGNTISGSLAAGCTKYDVQWNSTFRFAGGTIPGSVAGTTANGGVAA